MRKEYDFSHAERGKFYNPKATKHVPIYLDDEVQGYFAEKAKSKGVELNTLINDLLKKDIALVDGVK